MELLEYQAKSLFRCVGIPVLPSQIIDCPGDIKTLNIPYPVVLKSQVRSGNRMRAGGIKFVQNTIDAAAAAQAIFRLPIASEYPEAVLAEAKYEAERELYLCVTLDLTSNRPVLLGSPHGGEDLEAASPQMRKTVVDREFSPFYARRLALQLGLEGQFLLAVSNIIERMYRLFVEKDLDAIEINPLGIGAAGEVMALDGKIATNDHAIWRHEDLISMLQDVPSQARSNGTARCHSIQPHFARSEFAQPTLIRLEGNIALLCNGMGLTLATIDLIARAGGKAACSIDLNDRAKRPPTGSRTGAERLENIAVSLDRLAGEAIVRVVFANLLADEVGCDCLAETIAAWVQRRTDRKNVPEIVVRLAGRRSRRARKTLAEFEIAAFDRLDDAVDRAVAIAEREEAKREKNHA